MGFYAASKRIKKRIAYVSIKRVMLEQKASTCVSLWLCEELCLCVALKNDMWSALIRTQALQRYGVWFPVLEVCAM